MTKVRIPVTIVGFIEMDAVMDTPEAYKLVKAQVTAALCKDSKVGDHRIGVNKTHVGTPKEVA
jgi:hypothetical protein